MMTRLMTHLATHYEASLVEVIAQASLAIGRLDASVSGSSCGTAWALRAAWTGYARALQLQGGEIDGIDLFSWGCGIALPGRALRSTVVDEFRGFAPWRSAMAEDSGRHWQEDLPFTPVLDEAFGGAPTILRWIEVLHQYARRDASIEVWLAGPLLLRRFGLTMVPLPCLVVGDKGLRLDRRDWQPVLRRICGDLASAAADGLASLRAIEADRISTTRRIADLRRPGALLPLAVEMLARPVTTPEAIARRLGLTLSGAGKLLARAAELEIVREVSGRRSWRTYVAPDIAVSLGLVPRPRGRPAKRETVVAPFGSLDPLLSAFDAEMAELERRFPAAAMATD